MDLDLDSPVSSSSSTSSPPRPQVTPTSTRGTRTETLRRLKTVLTPLAILSLLPVQIGAKAVPRELRDRDDGRRTARRDRRRSSDSVSVSPAGIVTSIAISPINSVQRDIKTVSDGISAPLLTTPSPTKTNLRIRDGIPPPSATSTPTPTTAATFRRITVPATALPYLLTTDDQGRWGTANWEIYGRRAAAASTSGVSNEPDSSTVTVLSSLQDPSNPQETSQTSSSSTRSSVIGASDDGGDDVDTTFVITDALPRGWGISSDRGDLYAVPLITVASVCLAALIFAFIVITVVSRAKSKRRRARRERRHLKDQRNGRTGNNRSNPQAALDTDANPDRDDADDSSLGDEENNIGEIIRLERVAGQAERQRSQAGGMSMGESDMDGEEDRLRKNKHGGKGTRVRKVVSVGVGRLGNAKVLEWRRGLRKRKNASKETNSSESRTEGPQLAEVGLAPVGSDPSTRHDTAGRSSQTAVEGEGAEDTSGTAVDLGRTASMPSDEVSHGSLGDSTGPSAPGSGDQASGLAPAAVVPSLPVPPESADRGVDLSSGAGQPVSSIPGSTIAMPFPPAYFRAPADNVGAASSTQQVDHNADLPAHGETSGTTTVTGAPAAAALSSRALEKRPVVDYPAPTTLDQEQAVAVAFGHRGILPPVETGSIGSASASATGANLSTMTGHLATDDKGTLERLRMGGSMPLPPPDAEVDEGPLTESVQTGSPPALPTAPDFDLDEDGFERLGGASLTPPGVQDPPSRVSYPVPPPRIVQTSMLASEPSVPPVGSAPDVANLASAPMLDDPLDLGTAPSAPGEDDPDLVEDTHVPNHSPSAPELSSEQSPAGSSSSGAFQPGATIAQPTSAARLSHARRSLGLNLPSDDTAGSSVRELPAAAIPQPVRFLPKYEP